MNVKTPKNVPLIIIRVIVWGFMLLAAYLSFSHIVHFAQMMKVHGWQAYAAPCFVDGIAIVGKLSMLPRFNEEFRKNGKKLLMFGGLLSLVANIGAGESWGDRGMGVLVVAGFMILENHAAKAMGNVAAKKQGTICPQGCTCGKHAPRKPKAKPRTRKPRAAVKVNQYSAIPAQSGYTAPVAALIPTAATMTP